MNPEAQRIAIAEACGWTRGKRRELSFSNPDKQIEHDSWINPGGISERKLPDFLNDLNAIYEAEKVLNYYQQSEFVSRLSSKVSHGFNFCHATAAQRAQAFLRTIGKWQEQPQEQLV